MALQYIAGAVALSTLLSALFLKLLSFLLKFFTYKVAVGGAALIAFTLLMGSFVLAMNAIAYAIKSLLPPEYFAIASFYIPDNFSVFLSAVVTARLTQFGHYFMVKMFDIKLKASLGG